MNKLLMKTLLSLCALATGFGVAAETAFDLEALPHKNLQLPTGEVWTLVEYNGHSWRMVKPEILSGSNATNPEVCLEGKFAALEAPATLHILGQSGAVLVTDEELWKLAKTLKTNNNVWICGTLRPSSKGVELVAAGLAKLSRDVERFQNKRDRLLKQEDSARLLELAQEIDQSAKSPAVEFDAFDQLVALYQEIVPTALELEAKKLTPTDADGTFELAVKYRDLNKNLPKFREWLHRCLAINPNHPRGIALAQEEKWQQFRDKGWLAEVEIQKILDDEKHAREQAEKNKLIALEMEQEALKAAIAERPALLRRDQLSLRAETEESRITAIAALGVNLQKALDAEYAAQTVEMLAQLDEEQAVAAISQATQNKRADIRQAACLALAWRLTWQPQPAEGALTQALQHETAPENIRAIAPELTRLCQPQPKVAQRILIGALVVNKTAANELIESLKKSTQQKFNTQTEWEAWWNMNKE